MNEIKVDFYLSNIYYDVIIDNEIIATNVFDEINKLYNRHGYDCRDDVIVKMTEPKRQPARIAPFVEAYLQAAKDNDELLLEDFYNDWIRGQITNS